MSKLISQTTSEPYDLNGARVKDVIKVYSDSYYVVIPGFTFRSSGPVLVDRIDVFAEQDGLQLRVFPNNIAYKATKDKMSAPEEDRWEAKDTPALTMPYSTKMLRTYQLLDKGMFFDLVQGDLHTLTPYLECDIVTVENGNVDEHDGIFYTEINDLTAPVHFKIIFYTSGIIRPERLSIIPADSKGFSNQQSYYLIAEQEFDYYPFGNISSSHLSNFDHKYDVVQKLDVTKGAEEFDIKLNKILTYGKDESTKKLYLYDTNSNKYKPTSRVFDSNDYLRNVYPFWSVKWENKSSSNNWLAAIERGYIKNNSGIYVPLALTSALRLDYICPAHRKVNGTHRDRYAKEWVESDQRRKAFLAQDSVLKSYTNPANLTFKDLAEWGLFKTNIIDFDYEIDDMILDPLAKPSNDRLLWGLQGAYKSSDFNYKNTQALFGSTLDQLNYAAQTAVFPNSSTVCIEDSMSLREHLFTLDARNIYNDNNDKDLLKLFRAALGTQGSRQKDTFTYTLDIYNTVYPMLYLFSYNPKILVKNLSEHYPTFIGNVTQTISFGSDIPSEVVSVSGITTSTADRSKFSNLVFNPNYSRKFTGVGNKLQIEVTNLVQNKAEFASDPNAQMIVDLDGSDITFNNQSEYTLIPIMGYENRGYITLSGEPNDLRYSNISADDSDLDNLINQPIGARPVNTLCNTTFATFSAYDLNSISGSSLHIKPNALEPNTIYAFHINMFDVNNVITNTVISCGDVHIKSQAAKDVVLFKTGASVPNSLEVSFITTNSELIGYMRNYGLYKVLSTSVEGTSDDLIPVAYKALNNAFKDSSNVINDFQHEDSPSGIDPAYCAVFPTVYCYVENIGCYNTYYKSAFLPEYAWQRIGGFYEVSDNIKAKVSDGYQGYTNAVLNDISTQIIRTL